MEKINEIVSSFFSNLSGSITVESVFEWIKMLIVSKNSVGMIMESVGSFDFSVSGLLISFFESTLFKILFVIIALRIIFSYAFRRRSRSRTVDYTKQWNEISSMVESDDSYVRQLAVIKADQLMDDVLRGLGFSGATTQERIITASKKHSVMNDVISSHHVRNMIVHESGNTLTKDETSTHVQKYEKCLRYFKIIT